MLQILKQEINQQKRTEQYLFFFVASCVTLFSPIWHVSYLSKVTVSSVVCRIKKEKTFHAFFIAVKRTENKKVNKNI